MDMPTYKLTYFDLRVRGEPIRFLFAVAGVEFKDVRLTWGGPLWTEIKPTMTFGQLPVLEVDGQQLAQTLAISRYLAAEFGLLSKSAWDRAQADSHMFYLQSYLDQAVRLTFLETDENRKVELAKTLTETVAPTTFQKFENILKNEPSGFLFGNELSWADLVLAAYIECTETELVPELGAIVKTYTKLQQHKERIISHPAIIAWRKQRL